MRPPDTLWYDIETSDRGTVIAVNLTRCRNCGEVKVTSDSCGIDHLAAIVEFNAAVDR